MAIKLTETQVELLNLLYANVLNANEYCEALLSDGELYRGVKDECIRPLHVKIQWLKARLMSYMTPEKRQQVEDFAKSILA